LEPGGKPQNQFSGLHLFFWFSTGFKLVLNWFATGLRLVWNWFGTGLGGAWDFQQAFGAAKDA
jgi:hypothetical protein